mgnify:CR=1 FL=1
MSARPAVLAVLALLLGGCAAPEFDVPITFVVPDGHDSFDGLEYLSFTADYGGGLAYDFWLEAPESGSTWSIPSIPAGDTVRLDFTGLVNAGLGTGDQVVAASGGAGPVAIGPDLPGASILFSRRGRVGRLSGALAEGRRDPMSAVLADGSVLAVGGSRGVDDDGDPTPVASASLMRTDGAPGSWSFSALDAMRGPRMNGAAVAVSGSGTDLDGKVLILGTIPLLERRAQVVAIDFEESELNEARDIGMPEVFDPSASSWSDFGIDGAWEEQAARGFFTATQLGERLVVAGGIYYLLDGGEPVLRVSDECWEIDLGSGDVAPLANMVDTRWAHTATLLRDGRLLVVGGANVPTSNQTYPESTVVEAYDPAADEWTDLGDLEPGRADQIAALLPDGRVLIAGGVTEIETVALGDSWIFDPGNDSLTQDADMVTPRVRANHQVLPDGRVLVCGGEDSEQAAVTGCEVWTPGTDGPGVWSPMPDPGVAWNARSGSTLATLPGGEALVFGGLDAEGAYTTDALVIRP